MMDHDALLGRLVAFLRQNPTHGVGLALLEQYRMNRERLHERQWKLVEELVGSGQ